MRVMEIIFETFLNGLLISNQSIHYWHKAALVKVLGMIEIVIGLQLATPETINIKLSSAMKVVNQFSFRLGTTFPFNGIIYCFLLFLVSLLQKTIN